VAVSLINSKCLGIIDTGSWSRASFTAYTTSVKVGGGEEAEGKASFTACIISVREGGGGRAGVGFRRWRIAFGLNSGRLYIYEPIPRSILTSPSGGGDSGSRPKST
jgi:hypothetical protein